MSRRGYTQRAQGTPADRSPVVVDRPVHTEMCVSLLLARNVLLSNRAGEPVHSTLKIIKCDMKQVFVIL